LQSLGYNEPMTSSMKDLLQIRDYNEPNKIGIIKLFIKQHYDAEARVTVQPKQILINVNGAALAGSLQMQIYEMQQACNTQKKLVIRIGM